MSATARSSAAPPPSGKAPWPSPSSIAISPPSDPGTLFPSSRLCLPQAGGEPAYFAGSHPSDRGTMYVPTRVPGITPPAPKELDHAALHAPLPRPQSHPAHQRLRRMSENGRYLGPSSSLPRMWTRRLLRFFQKQTRHQTLPSHETSHHAFSRTRRILGLVLRRRDRTRLLLGLRQDLHSAFSVGVLALASIPAS